MLPRLPLLSRDIQSWKAPNATDKRGTHGFPCERILGKSAHSSETSAHVTVCTHTHRQATPSAGSSRWVWPDKATSARAQPIAAQQRNGEWVCRGMAGDKGWRRRRVWVLCALACSGVCAREKMMNCSRSWSEKGSCHYATSSSIRRGGSVPNGNFTHTTCRA